MNDPRMSGAVSPDEFRRLRDIFESALERPPAERSRYIERACAGDATLIGEVERMLRADAEHHRILDASVLLWAAAAAVQLIPQPTALEPGRRIGPYEIISFVAAGGMGEVYRARDTRLKRDVALKILPESVAADRERIARFEREAELLASLNHPYIANIYGVEEDHGTCQLVGAPSGDLRWSETVHVPVGDLFEVQDSLSRRIVRSLPLADSDGSTLVPQDVPAAPHAYELYLRANQLSYDDPQWGLAKSLYEQCVTIDPSYAPAWAKLGRINRVIGKSTNARQGPRFKRPKRIFGARSSSIRTCRLAILSSRISKPRAATQKRPFSACCPAFSGSRTIRICSARYVTCPDIAACSTSPWPRTSVRACWTPKSSPAWSTRS